MASPIPKRASERQRRNKTTTAARFEVTGAPMENPELGRHPTSEDGAWHPRTLDFWREVWESPMREEYLRADLDGLFALAVLIDQFWRHPSYHVAAEIRLQRQCYGLTPIDRRRLQWEVVRAETAGRARPKATTPKGDPRSALRAV